MNICFSILHIDEDTEKSKYRKECLNSVISTINNQIDLVKHKTYKISNIQEFKSYRELHNDINIDINLKYGEIGCLASHYESWQELLNSNYDAILVIEDDAKVSKRFLDLFSLYLKEVPTTFDIVSLYVHPAKTDRYVEELHSIGLSNICKGYQNQSTLAYLLSKKGAEKYIKYLKTVFDKPLDLFLFDLEKDIEFYSISPSAFPIFYTDTLDDDGEVIRDFTLIQDTDYILGGLKN